MDDPALRPQIIQSYERHETAKDLAQINAPGLFAINQSACAALAKADVSILIQAAAFLFAAFFAFGWASDAPSLASMKSRTSGRMFVRQLPPAKIP